MSIPEDFDAPIMISVTVAVVILAFIVVTITFIRRISMSIDNVSNELDNLRLCLDRHLRSTDDQLEAISINTYNAAYSLAKDFEM